MASRRGGILLFFICSIATAVAAEDDEEFFSATIRAQVDELYSIVCRDPVQVFTPVEYLLMVNPPEKYPIPRDEYEEMRRSCHEDPGKCPKLVEPYHVGDIIPYQIVYVKRCQDRFAYCPTVAPSKCISYPGTERRKQVTFLLNDRTIQSITAVQHTQCRCACQAEEEDDIGKSNLVKK